jgi:hypothetical protein
MQVVIVFRKCDHEVRSPSQLSVNIPLFIQLGVIWHSSAFGLVHFIGIQHPSRLHQNGPAHSLGFVEVLLKEHIIRLGNITKAKRAARCLTL